MSTTVDLSTEVVKILTVDSGRQWVVLDLAKRIEWVLEHRAGIVKNESQWALRAGLSRQHIDSIKRRLKVDPEAGQEVETLRALADAAKVSRPWFIDGSGAPDDDDPFPNRYPALLDVLAKHPGRWSAPAIAAARSLALDADSDPGDAWWVETLDRLDAAIKVSVPKLPPRGNPLAGI